MCHHIPLDISIPALQDTIFSPLALLKWSVPPETLLLSTGLMELDIKIPAPQANILMATLSTTLVPEFHASPHMVHDNASHVVCDIRGAAHQAPNPTIYVAWPQSLSLMLHSPM